jgi:hypothetical protein
MVYLIAKPTFVVKKPRRPIFVRRSANELSHPLHLENQAGRSGAHKLRRIGRPHPGGEVGSTVCILQARKSLSLTINREIFDRVKH